MSAQSPKDASSGFEIVNELLETTEFDAAAGSPPESLEGSLGELVSCETILETTEFDCSKGITQPPKPPSESKEEP